MSTLDTIFYIVGAGVCASTLLGILAAIIISRIEIRNRLLALLHRGHQSKTLPRNRRVEAKKDCREIVLRKKE